MQHLTPGLSILPKLKHEHIHLTSYSKMRVDLAAQVSFSYDEANSHILSMSSIIGAEQICCRSVQYGRQDWLA